MDRPAAGGFLSLTGPSAPRVMVSPLRTMSMKSALRAYLTVSYDLISILLTGSLRSPPFGGCATTFPPQAGALQPVLNLESLMKKLPHGALLCHRLRGKSRAAGKGECLSLARRAVVKVLS